MLSYVFAALLALTAAGYVVGRRRALGVVDGEAYKLHSRPTYHGAYIAAWVGLPALLLVLLWLLFQESVIEVLMVQSLPDAETASLNDSQISLLMSEIRSVAAGQLFTEPKAFILEAAERYSRWQGIARWAMFAVVVIMALAALVLTRARISQHFHARQGVDRDLGGHPEEADAAPQEPEGAEEEVHDQQEQHRAREGADRPLVLGREWNARSAHARERSSVSAASVRRKRGSGPRPRRSSFSPSR